MPLFALLILPSGFLFVHIIKYAQVTYLSDSNFKLHMIQYTAQNALSAWNIVTCINSDV